MTGCVSQGAGPSSQGTSHGMGTDDMLPMSDGSKIIFLECIASTCETNRRGTRAWASRELTLDRNWPSRATDLHKV